MKAFKSFDKGHDGKITMYEFRYILSQLGNMFTEEECDQKTVRKINLIDTHIAMTFAGIIADSLSLSDCSAPKSKF